MRSGFVLCLQVLAAVTAFAGGNLLVNSGFETDGLGESLNWAFDQEPERLTGQGPKGETAMRIRSLAYQRGFKAVTGEKYRFSAWVRSHNCSGRLLVVNGRWWWQELSADIPADTHGEWKRIEMTGEMVSLGPVNVPVPDGTVGPAQFCVQPSPKDGGSYIDFCDPQVEPLSEPAIAKSVPADAVAKLPTRLVPVDPLLDEVDSADAKLRFFYSGDLAKNPAEYEIEASLDGTHPIRRAMDAKCEATVPFGAIAAGRHRVTVRLFEKGSSAALKENVYPITARPRRTPKVSGRRLNNLVTEIANRTLADGEYEFVNPREGWVYVGFDGRYAKARAFVDRGTEPVIRPRDGERSETMRYLSKGLHTVLVTGVRGDAKAEAGRFTIRLVKTLYNRSLDFKADRTDYANYQYRADYYRRWIYGSFNTIAFYQDWQCSPGEVAAEEAEFAPRGVRIFRQIDCWPMDVKLRSDPKRLADLMENSPSYRDGYELSMDETGFRTTPRAGIANWGEYLWSTVERRLAQPMHQWWCDIPMYVPRNRQLLVSPFAANVNSGGGRGLMLLETYHGTYPDEAKVDRELDCLKEYYRALGEMVPSAPSRTLPLFGGFLTLGHFCNAAYPEGDIKGVYDKFMHAIATDPAFAEVGGIGVTGYYCDEELPRFLARAIRHYAIEGRTERFGERYGITPVPGILNGGDFDRGLEGWTVSAAEEGSITTGSNRSLGGGYQQRVCAQGGTWNTYALFVRSDKAPNRISRKISGLVKGRLYALQFCTADRDDVLKPGKFPKGYEFRAEVRGAEAIDALHLVRIWPFEKGQLSNPQVTFVTERLVFRATSETAEIFFSDWKDDAKHIRPAGEGRILNYVGVRPYFVEDGDFDDLVKGCLSANDDIAKPRHEYVSRVKYDDEFIDRMWLWGHLSGQVDGTNNLYHLDEAKGDYPMSAALKELGLRNLNVIRWDRPSLDVLREFKDVKRLTLPGAAHDAEGVKDYSVLHDHVFAAASEMDNVVGIELDDYYRSNSTNEVYTVTAMGELETCPAAFGPETLAALRARADRFRRPLDLRLVVYDDLFTERANPTDLVPAIDQATAVTYWTWKAENLKDLEKNFRFYRTLAPTKSTFLGIYLYDFGGEREMTAEEMRLQLDFALRKFREGEIEGVVFLCSSIVNRDFEAIRIAKEWIRENGKVRRRD